MKVKNDFVFYFGKGQKLSFRARKSYSF